MLFRHLIRPMLFGIDPERAHTFTIAMLKTKPRTGSPVADRVLRSEVAGLVFPNPVGIAAGVDKDAEVPLAFLALGFGFAEVGTLTPLPQAGNPRPRLFRLEADRGVINRMGFNNEGQLAAIERLRRIGRHPGPIGVNIGANKDSEDRIADYAKGAKAMGPFADYLTVNISSPNTPGLRALQDKSALGGLIDAVLAGNQADRPVFLKVAPDLDPADIEDIAAVAIDKRLAALIVGNTTISRDSLHSPQKDQAGGLSGVPLAGLAMQRLRDFRSATGGAIPLVAVGGIGSAEEAYARIRAGASLVQLYSALVYEGPGLARAIATGLAKLLKRDGFARLEDAIGIDAD